MIDTKKSVDESIKVAEDMIKDFTSIIYKYEDYPDAARHLDVIEISKDAREIIKDLVQHIRTLDPEYFDRETMINLNNVEMEGFGVVK